MFSAAKPIKEIRDLRGNLRERMNDLADGAPGADGYAIDHGSARVRQIPRNVEGLHDCFQDVLGSTASRDAGQGVPQAGDAKALPGVIERGDAPATCQPRIRPAGPGQDRLEVSGHLRSGHCEGPRRPPVECKFSGHDGKFCSDSRASQPKVPIFIRR